MSIFLRLAHRYRGCRTFQLALTAMIFVYLLVVDAAGLWGWLDTLAGDEVASALPLTLAIGIGFWVSDDTAWRRPRWTLLPSAIVMATPWVIGQNDWWLLGAWPAAAKLAMVPLLLASWLVPWLEADRRWLLRQPLETNAEEASDARPLPDLRD